MDRRRFLFGASGVAASVPLALSVSAAPYRAAGIEVPDTALAAAAMAIAKSSLPSPILNHCLRTFFFAELVAALKNIEHDREVVFVASILHDTGLSPLHMSKRERFEVDGANVARSLVEAHGVPAARADLIWDAIALHDDGGIARWKQPEVVLVNAGVNTDFGAFLDVLNRGQVSEILRAAPRGDFVPVFIEAVAEIARRKPFATGNCFVTDVAYRKVPGFHLDNFCDVVKDDPFASFT